MLRVLQIVAAPSRSKVGIGINGPERRSANLVNQWTKVGVVPVICYPQRGRCWVEFEKAKVPLIDFEIQSKLDFSAVKSFCRIIEEHQVSVVHTQGPPSVDLFAALAARRRHVGMVVTRPFMLAENISYSRSKKVLYGCIDLLTLRLADTVVAVSQAGHDFLGKQNGLRGDKLKLVYNGIDLTRVQPFLRPTNVKPLTLGMVAQLTPAKGWEVFISVIQELIRRGHPVCGLIVGDGPLRHSLEKQVADRGLANRIEFSGYQSSVAAVLRAVTIFLFTSFREGLSVAIIEALAAGLPIVATDVGGTREQVVDGINGFVCKPGDVPALVYACERLIVSAELRATFGAASRARAEELFSEHRMLLQYAEVYRGAVKARAA